MLRIPHLFRSSKTIVAVIFILLILGGLTCREHRTSPSSCPLSTTGDRVVVAIKTGATEASEKKPTLMKTSLRCAKHVVIFSDLEQRIGEYQLHDALESISPSVMEHADFDFYKQQQEAWARDQNIDALRGAKHAQKPNELAAWTLDKYKNMHIVEKTWKAMPDMDWYVFIDADTYVVWLSLLCWLPSLDSSKLGWFGSRVFLGNVEFSHGGSGVLLSRETVHNFAVVHNGTAARWESQTPGECCGDYILSKALAEYGNKLVNIRPLINGQTPAIMPMLNEYWCLPTVTMHHVTTSEMEEFRDFEVNRSDTSVPINFAEIFESLVKDRLRAMMTSPREDWDNVSWEVEIGSGLSGSADEKLTTDSVATCAAACEEQKECMQYVHDGQTCFIGKAIRLGERREPVPEQGKKWHSGWQNERVEEWISRQTTCDAKEFPAPIERVG